MEPLLWAFRFNRPGLIMNHSAFGASAYSNAFDTASAAEITGCLQLGLGPAIENNHNNIINNNTLTDSNTLISQPILLISQPILLVSLPIH